MESREKSLSFMKNSNGYSPTIYKAKLANTVKSV